jgi:hypothetical protein
MPLVQELQPGRELDGFFIEAVEREDVLLATDTAEDRPVALHVAHEPPGALSTIRFTERVRRLRSVDHPHLLRVYGAETLGGRCIAVAQAPPGRRLDQLRPSRGHCVRIVRQVAEAVDALEEAGAEPPPLVHERIWIDDAGDAHLDGLDARERPHRAASSSAALADLLHELAPRAERPLATVLTRARDGAYLSAGQLATELGDVEAEVARRRRTALVAAIAVALLALAVILGILV